jgi:hypothetical protein
VVEAGQDEVFAQRLEQVLALPAVALLGLAAALSGDRRP